VFGALFRHVLSTTVLTAASIRLMPVPHPDWSQMTWALGSFSGLKPVPVRLTSRGWLLAAQTLGIRESRRDGQFWLTTLRSVYSWQVTDDDASWLVRWEYDRDGAGPYPSSHIHVNAEPVDYEGEKYFPKLHLPSGRVAIEDVLEFLVTEQGVIPHSTIGPRS
jgi:hypothetical protein